MTHYATAVALTSVLVDAGARRVRLVESTQRRTPLEATLAEAGWDVPALSAVGKVEFENTRNLGLGKKYSHFHEQLLRVRGDDGAQPDANPDWHVWLRRSTFRERCKSARARRDTVYR